MSKAKKIFIEGLWKDNPIFRQILGICSALAVTNLMVNSFVMGIGLIFVTSFSSLTVSILRTFTPKHIRMMVQTLIISSYVIIVDIVLKAYYPTMSEALGPYVGLIITNCIIMGRCEAFAQNNPPFASFLDGIASGIGYAFILLFIAFFRELAGFGTLFGFPVLGDWWMKWSIMVMPPGAFFMLAIVIWLARNLSPENEDEKEGATA
ncbi:NADH:ubiquinone reductase (Na(+)-transporting) subunit D [Geosporobacter ferrireducens]|uniref:NADH:ubiquinone reductase (Na(+)-transporting) subunit D n=1 Tax=Geosporobacter ferrireducens TaxID=1424294 RepID=A0A1D8GCG3_9FIRM|nr:NADH:ubiquinone reductase (Na(+)-transporting) subunit D [Geosporobacter ferrireducens]AOT68589.1 NADH:ubiquinone reductase (Na(+)-transporting) subunit D [Geosporobacter ferrireducens]MTI54058.1 NADH:ubiquinone reductase (Na(+)-transporting) subunit D [Geosporobacter ferrireducens]